MGPNGAQLGWLGVVVDGDANAMIALERVYFDGIAFKIPGIDLWREYGRDFLVLNVVHEGMPLEVGHRNHVVRKKESRAG